MLVIFLISLLTFGCEVHAEENLNIKFDRPDRSIERNRRDFQGFYGQIFNAANFRILSCDLKSCSASANSSVCKGFCSSDTDLVNQAYTAAVNCLNTVSCNLNSWQLNDVRIPIAVDGYNGVCSLSGKQVTVSGGNNLELSTPSAYGVNTDSSPIYSLSLLPTLTYEGLSINCSSSNLDSSSSGGTRNDSLSQLLDLLRDFISDLISLENDTNAENDGDRGSMGSQFTANITVNQTYEVVFITSFYGIGTSKITNLVTTSVDLGSGVPAEYQAQVKVAVKLLLDNFYIVDEITDSFVDNINMAIHTIYDETCDQSKCETAQTSTTKLE